MISKRSSLILFAILLTTILAVGCTSTTTTTIGSPASGAATTTVPAAAVSSAPVTTAMTVPQATPGVSAVSQCPDRNVWAGPWDTRWKSEGKDISPDPNYPGYPWSGVDSPGATPVVLTQDCRDVTGTYVQAGNAGGSGTITAKIEAAQLKGTYKTVWQGSSDTEYGTFTLTMAADNQSWVGYAKGHDRGDYQDPNNWIGRR
jgi:hypothetical protein